MVRTNNRIAIQSTALAILMMAVVILPGCTAQMTEALSSKKCDDDDATMSKKCTPCGVACLPTMNLTSCEVNLFTSGFMDMAYATSLVPASLGTPWTDPGGMADGSLQIWQCSGGSLSNGTPISNFTLVLYSVSLVTNASLPHADFNGRMSTLALTDNLVVAKFLHKAGANVTLTPFTTNWVPGTLAGYAPMSLAATGHFQIVREGAFNNQANADWPYQFFTKAAPATWFQFYANQTWQSLPTVLHLDSQDSFWANDPAFGGRPVTFQGAVAQVASATFRVESL